MNHYPTREHQYAVSYKAFGNFSDFVVAKRSCAFHLITYPFSLTTTASLLV